MIERLCLISILIVLLLGSSCREDFEYEPSKGNLEFSKDTVYLDTTFTTIGSSTYTLKVYNRTRDDVAIPSIRLGKGQNSSYRLNVDGVAGKEFEDIPIFARDSIFIFIESTFDIAQSGVLEFLNTDVIQFDTGDRLQEVQLVSLVRDAVFLYPRTLADGTKEKLNIGFDGNGDQIVIDGFYLEDGQLNFTNQKPYVIYGYAAVPGGRQLVMDPGTRVYFHKDSGIYVEAGGNLVINGELSESQELLEKEVIFEGDRLDSELAEIPGQWGTVWIAMGSINNSIDHLTIKNATVGLYVEGDAVSDSPTLTLKNSQVYNSSSINLWARTAAITAENVVLGNAGNTSLYCNLGGKFSFIHSTIANFWSNSFRLGAAVHIDNFTGDSSSDLVQGDFVNCIIDGNRFIELELRGNQNNTFNYSFTNCLIKFRDDGGLFKDDPFYDFENKALFNEVLLNTDANFFNTGVQDFRIKEPSAARDKANFEAANQVPFDLLGKDRTGSPDIGPYEVDTEM